MTRRFPTLTYPISLSWARFSKWRLEVWRHNNNPVCPISWKRQKSQGGLLDIRQTALTALGMLTQDGLALNRWSGQADKSRSGWVFPRLLDRTASCRLMQGRPHSKNVIMMWRINSDFAGSLDPTTIEGLTSDKWTKINVKICQRFFLGDDRFLFRCLDLNEGAGDFIDVLTVKKLE